MNRVTLSQYETLLAQIAKLVSEIETYEHASRDDALLGIHDSLCDQLWAIRDKALWAY